MERRVAGRHGGDAAFSLRMGATAILSIQGNR